MMFRDLSRERFISLFYIITICLLLIFSNTQSKSQIVHQVIDGDTFLLEEGQTIRMLGIDAPEIGQPGYDLSSLFLSCLAEGERVYFEQDLLEQDQYGRLLRYVFLQKKKVMINELMLYYGLADFRYIDPEAKYYERLARAAREAEQNKHSLWIFDIFPPTQIGEDQFRPMIFWNEAKNYINQMVTVEGIIVRTHDSGKVCFLNFDFDWKNTLNLVIFHENYQLFLEPPAKYYLNKKIQATGLIQFHEDKLQMIIKSAQMIRLIN